MGRLKFFFLMAFFSQAAFSDCNLEPKDSSGKYVKDAASYITNANKNQYFSWCDGTKSSSQQMVCDKLKDIVTNNYIGSPLTLSSGHQQDHFATQDEINAGKCTFEDPRKFAFKIFLNGVDANLYVCQVGFKNHLCETCGGDYMEIYSGNNKVRIDGPNKFLDFQKGEIIDGYAQVFLNTFSTGSSYFVKYCLDVNNLVQNNTSILGTVNGVLNSVAHIYPGAASAYFKLVNLKASVLHECAGEGQTILNSFLLDTNPIHPEATDILLGLNTANPGTLVGKNCSWTYIFSETKAAPRSLVRDPNDPLSQDGQMVHTEIDYYIDFLCLNGSTSCDF